MNQLWLAVARRGKTCVAGILFRLENSTVRFWKVGYKDGDPAHLRSGSATALKYFALRRFAERGFTKCDFGYTAALLRDGVLRYKKNWNVRLVDEGQSGSLIIPLADSAATQTFFLQMPMICIHDDTLVGTVFVRVEDLQSTRDFERLHRDFYYDGMDHLRVLVADGSAAGVPVPEHLRQVVSVESAASLFSAWHNRDAW
jgi:hypothetical protein